MLLSTVAFGTIEYGYGWRSSMSVLTAARAGAREGVASSGTDYLSDYLALSGLRTNLDSVGMLDGHQVGDRLQGRPPANGQPPTRCI